jgi:putative FmdB family regulatory protein
MPVYDYKCSKCNKTFPVTYSLTESPEIFCPTCKAVAKKVFGVGAVTFKGSGWGGSN